MFQMIPRLEQSLNEPPRAPECAEQVVLVASQSCKPCIEVKDALADFIERGEVLVLDSHTEEGIKLLEENQLEVVPQLLKIDCRGEVVEYLELDPGSEPEGEGFQELKDSIFERVRETAIKRK